MRIRKLRDASRQADVNARLQLLGRGIAERVGFGGIVAFTVGAALFGAVAGCNDGAPASGRPAPARGPEAPTMTDCRPQYGTCTDSAVTR